LLRRLGEDKSRNKIFGQKQAPNFLIRMRNVMMLGFGQNTIRLLSVSVFRGVFQRNIDTKNLKRII
jgi:hypothetical protein